MVRDTSMSEPYALFNVFENLVLGTCVCFVLCKFVSGLILWFSGIFMA